jgi:hypothetical protein
MNQISKPLKNEKGVAVPMLAVSMMAIVFCVGIGVDIGRLAVVADEVQNAADIAATAAAFQFVKPGEDTSTPRESAEDILSQNEINNTSVASSNLTLLEFGNYNVDTDTFTANLAPINAAHSRVEYTANNIVFAGLGRPTTLVAKEAIAAFQPSGGGTPTIPLTIGDCLLNTGCTEDECQPTLTQVPNPDDNSAWTGFFQVASTSEISTLFPEVCEDDAVTPPYIQVGDFINLINGQSVPLLNMVECMLENNLTEVLVPVTECGGSLNQAREVLGFARFEILAVTSKGGDKGITIRGLTSASDGPSGGENFGAGIITLVR